MATSQALEADLWRDLQPDFRTSHYLDGFAHADKKFHFKADWAHPPFGVGRWAISTRCRACRTIGRVIEEADEAHPFRLATSPSRSFLNTTFNETPSSQAREGKASVMIHPLDAAALDIADGDAVTLGNTRGETSLIARLFDGVRRGVLIAESVHPNSDHIGGRGINMLTGADSGRADRRRRVPRQQGLDQESRSASASSQRKSRACSAAPSSCRKCSPTLCEADERHMTDNTASSSRSADRRSGSPSTGRTSATRSMATSSPASPRAIATPMTTRMCASSC